MLNEKEGTHMETISLTHSLGGNTSANLGDPLKVKTNDFTCMLERSGYISVKSSFKLIHDFSYSIANMSA